MNASLFCDLIMPYCGAKDLLRWSQLCKKTRAYFVKYYLHLYIVGYQNCNNLVKAAKWVKYYHYFVYNKTVANNQIFETSTIKNITFGPNVRVLIYTGVNRIDLSKWPQINWLIITNCADVHNYKNNIILTMSSLLKTLGQSKIITFSNNLPELQKADNVIIDSNLFKPNPRDDYIWNKYIKIDQI